MYYFLIIAGIVALDQVSKYLVVSKMALYESIPVLGEFVRITYIQNTGAAFSIMEGQKIFLLGLPAIFIMVGLVYLAKHKKNRGQGLLMGVSFIIAGGIGNFIDRVFQGYVVDMIQVGTFPIFNLADVFVCIGCALVCIYVIFFDGKKHGKR